jgi:hypothetical protein
MAWAFFLPHSALSHPQSRAPELHTLHTPPDFFYVIDGVMAHSFCSDVFGAGYVFLLFVFLFWTGTLTFRFLIFFDFLIFGFLRPTPPPLSFVFRNFLSFSLRLRKKYLADLPFFVS